LSGCRLKGYSTLANVPLKSGKPGGREEADIIGFKLKEQDVWEIVHVECGSLGKNFKDNLERVKRKFSPDRVRVVKTFLQTLLELKT